MPTVDVDRLTVGVEEEFLLLEPNGTVAPVAADVVRIANINGAVKPEFMPFQVETTTGVCTRLDGLRSELARLRSRAARSAEAAGALLVASGMPPYPVGPITFQADGGRYDELRRRFPWAVPSLAACGCHVHVGVRNRDVAVNVLARLRAWLATLLALGGNSPIVDGRDTAWSSRRYVTQLRWPTFRPPEAWPDAAAYDRSVRTLIARGAAADARSLYFLARLSPRYPTVEVRVGDACLTVDDAVLLAAVVRALVTTLVQDVRQSSCIEPVSRASVCSRLMSAAHDGMSMAMGGCHPPIAAVDSPMVRLWAKILPALDSTGEAEYVLEGLHRLCREGNGADRQRLLWVRATNPTEFVGALADVTVSGARSLSL